MKNQLRLSSLEKFGWRFGLETTQTLLSLLDNPHSSLRFIHVAGSNGKGSTCAFMASFLKQCGYKTGLYTSPHLCDIRERFRINGQWISSRDLERHSARVLKACALVKKKLGHYPTHFEALTAIAFCWFKEKKVDWVVLEVGLGGRLDATNVISFPALSLITPIGLEHQAILGKTIRQIAGEKAEIIKAGCFTATVQYHRDALKVIRKKASGSSAELWSAGKEFSYHRTSGGFYWSGPGLRREIRLPHEAEYQVANAALAVAGIQYLRNSNKVRASLHTVEKALSAMRWPGRTEMISRNPLILVDGAHNPDGAKALSVFLKRQYPRRRWIVLNGLLADKDHRTFIEYLKPVTSLAIVTEPRIDRAEKGEIIFKAWEQQGVPAILVKDWRKALEPARLKLAGSDRSTGLLITGSLYLVGDCRKQLIGVKDLKNI
jgi:dihydrofolate synthase/folylpolyglutamate synthase